jgi:hypothetical protein
MKATDLGLLLSALAMLAGCKERPRGETSVVLPITTPAAPVQKPVVSVAPVPTKPFEEGYDAGYELGKQQAKPQAKIPEPEEVELVAREQSAGHPERNERWERGFVEGYTDGFRNVVTGKK